MPAVHIAHQPGRAAVAALMSRSKREVPHYYVATTVDLHATTEWLRRTNRTRAVTERVVPAAALLRATALTLRDTPALNGFWRDDAFVPGEGVHLAHRGARVQAGDLSAREIWQAMMRDMPISRANRPRRPCRPNRGPTGPRLRWARRQTRCSRRRARSIAARAGIEC